MRYLASSLVSYLLEYTKYSKDITVCYRPTLKDHWGNRCKAFDKKFNVMTPYNHRSILPQEIVFEYDTDNDHVNQECIDRIAQKLNKEGVKWAKWNSGNKSVHLHCLLDFNHEQIKYLFLLKRVLLRFYGTFYIKDDKVYNTEVEGSKRLTPDMRLAEDRHLIRAEYGVHEKTGNKKTLRNKHKEYPCLSPTPDIWMLYNHEVREHLTRKAQPQTKDLYSSKYIKYLLSTNFRDVNDGRERALFILCNVLRPQYEDKKELVSYLQDWYKYAGGYKMTPWQIQCKVEQGKQYTMTEFFVKEFLEELGVKID